MKIVVWQIVAIVAVVLVVVGVLLNVVPVESQGSQTVTPTTPYAANVTGWAITGSIYVSFSWSAPSAVNFELVTCPAIISTGICNGKISYINQTGTSGSGSFQVLTGGYIAAFVSSSSGPPTATLKITTSEPTIGLITIVLGLVLLGVAYSLRKRKRENAAGRGWMDGASYATTQAPPGSPPQGPTT